MIDYSKIGMKAGLEIHQQLDTGKLFCSCPSYLKSEKPDFVVHRKLHKVAGETGEVDVAVEYESSLNKEFAYECYNDNVCLIDLDEEPPHQINEHALDEALKIALLLNCEIYTITQIMRKTVIDGSNTSGFQRTVLIAHGGFVETSFGKVGVESVALEEDSGRLVDEDERKTTYKLDRLGIPLIEIATKPELYSSEQVKECALKIGEILRACKVKRGIGTIRQDLNINIKGHDRVEVKGFQEPSMMIKTVDLEIERQQRNIAEGKRNGEVRGALETGETKFNRPMPGGARMYPETDLPILKIGREKINELKKHLPKLRNEIRDELKRKGLSDEMINLIVGSGEFDEFETLLRVYSKDANLIVKMVSLWRSELGSRGKKSFEEVKKILNERVLEEILESLKEGEITESDVKQVMIKVIEGTSVEDALKIERVSDDKMEEAIVAVVKEKPGLRANAYMGLVIQKLGAAVDKRKVMEILNKLVEGK